jgi:hypothetical protein
VASENQLSRQAGRDGLFVREVAAEQGDAGQRRRGSAGFEQDRDRARQRHAHLDLVQPDLRAAPQDPVVGAQRQDAAARHRVAVHRRHDRPREAEDLEHHAVEVPHERVERRGLELVQRDQVQPRREEALVAGQHDRPRVRPRRLRERIPDRPQAPRVQRVALPAVQRDLERGQALQSRQSATSCRRRRRHDKLSRNV